MSYRYDHLLVIANKYSFHGLKAKAELFETYDKIRDLTVSGPSIDGSGFGPTAKLLMNFARLFAPASFMPVLSNDILGIPGTSFFSSESGSHAVTHGGQSAYGISSMGKHLGMPSGGAASINTLGSAVGSLSFPLLTGIGAGLSSLKEGFTIGGSPTGAASALNTLVPMAGAVSGVAAGATQPQGSIILPVAGAVAGIGGLISSLGPYFGPFGLLAGIAGNLASGYGGAVINEYQAINGRILNNADVVLQSKVRNIETVVKQLDTQSDIIRKMLKDGADGDKNALQNLL